jgi:hypothetical protein
MKKKLFILATTSLFSLGLALYANHSNSIDVLGSSDVEALSDGNEHVIIMENRIETDDYIEYTDLHKLFVKHGSNKQRWSGGQLNTCKLRGADCLIDLDDQTGKERTDNESWASKVEDWVLETAKEVVINLIKKIF